MKTFTKLFLFNAVVLTSLFFAYQQGLLQQVFQHDKSYMSTVILAVYAYMSYYVSQVGSQLDKCKLPLSKKDSDAINKKLKLSWFVSGQFFNLGMIGTVIGFCIAMAASLAPNGDPNAIVAELKVGASTLMFTTLFGLVASVLLQIQNYIVTHNAE